MDIQLNNQQSKVLSEVKEFLRNDTPIFILKGYAGTGKTTMIKQIVNLISQERQGDIRLMAPTGRAARVLGKKTGLKSFTIHKTIYDLNHYQTKEVQDIADTIYKIHFDIMESNGTILAIVDESSMISSRKSEHEIFQFGTGILLDDLLTYIRPSFGGKVIFVGDPAQLPPVGDNHSYALDSEYFASKGLKVMESQLTQVMRQNGDSCILKNAMHIRDILKESKRNRLTFISKEDEVEIVEPANLVDKYIQSGKEAASGGSVIIAYSNRKVCEYNKEIRRRKFGDILPLQIEEPLMVVANNYTNNLMNGDFTKVVKLGAVEQLSAPVYVQKGGEKKKEIITISFQEAVVLNNEGLPRHCKLILNLLDSHHPNLTVYDMNALYINFRMRYPHLKPDSQPFVDTLKADPYNNALVVKYGYAVTGHKCQGGEWEKSFVDYEGRTGLDDDCLRWNYTATTRAQNTLYVTNLRNITPFDNFHLVDVSTMKKVNPEFRRFGVIPEDPWHSADSEDFLRAKYYCILENSQSLPYKVKNITSKPYLEIYEIETPEGLERYDLIYKSCGVFLPAKTNSTTSHSVFIKMILKDEHAMPIVCDYKPSDDLHNQLYSFIQSACDELGIRITNIVEHNENYYTMYYFSTSSTTSYIQVYTDAKGFIKFAKPMSFLGEEDEELKRLVELLKR